MQEKKISPIYLVIKYLIKVFSPKYQLLGKENLPDEACIIVGNHSQMYGPIAAELYSPVKRCTWCAGEMMNIKEVSAYAYEDFWSKKPVAVRWFYKFLSRMIPPLSVLVFNSAETIAVYHDSRLISTFRESIEKLQAGTSIVIFPECYTEYNNIVHDFQDKFVDLARFYYRKTGRELTFVPMYLAPRLGTMSYGNGIRFHADAPIEQERRRICTCLKESITAMALSQEEHTVVPYPNIPKKQYKKNIPLEVYHS